MSVITEKIKGHSIGFIMAGCNLASSAIVFLITMFLARSLGATNYGVIAYALVITGILTTVSAFAADRTLVRDLVHSQNPNVIFTASIKLRGMLSISVIIIFSIYFTFNSDLERDNKLVGFIILIWGLLFTLQPKAWFDVNKRMHYQAYYNLAERVSYLFLIILLFIYSLPGIPSVVNIAITMLLPRILFFILQWVYVMKSLGFRYQFINGSITKIITDNWLIYLAMLSNLLMSHYNQLVLENQGGIKLFASYSIAFQIVVVVQIIQNQYLRYVSPKIAVITKIGKNPSRIKKSLFKYLFNIGMGTLLVILPISIIVPYYWSDIFGPDYPSIKETIWVLCFWLIMYSFGLVSNRFIVSLRLNKIYITLSVVGGLISIGLGYWLVPKIGPLGVALSLLLAHSITIIGQLYSIKTKIHSMAVSQEIE